MRTLAFWLSMAALAANIAPSVLFLMGRMELGTMKTATLAATVAWYVVATFWIYGTKPPALEEPVIP